MSYCPQCGAETPEGAAFCGACGTPLSAPSYDATLDQESNPYAVGAQADMSVDQYQGGEPKPTFGETLKRCFGKKYADFSGRASRREYWFFIVWNVILFIAVVVLSSAISGALVASGIRLGILVSAIAMLVWAVYLIVPGCAVMARRFHDVGLPTWLAVVSFVATNLGNGIRSFITTRASTVAQINRAAPTIDDGLKTLMMAAGILVAIFGLLNFVVALIPGAKSPNKFGPPPAPRK